MSPQVDRLVRIFIWKEGDTPAPEYVRALVKYATSHTGAEHSLTTPTTHLFSAQGDWPDDPWDRALEDLSRFPAPGGGSWIDSEQYELVGWQGTDSHTGDCLFVVSAFKRVPPTEDRTGNDMLAQPQVELTEDEHTQAVGSPDDGESAPIVPDVYDQPASVISWETHPAWEEAQPTLAGMPSRYSPFQTAPLVSIAPEVLGTSLGSASSIPTADNYSRYYVGFGPRLMAQFIDLGFILLFPLIGLAAVYLVNPQSPLFSNPQWGSYLLLCGTLFGVFLVYHVLQIGLWGQTLGKKLLSIRVVTISGTSPSFSRALLRWFGFIFSIVPFGLGLALVALDLRKQGLHDKIAETYVIPEDPPADVPLGLPGYVATLGASTFGTGEEAMAGAEAQMVAMASVAAITDLPLPNIETPPAFAGTDDQITGPFVGFERDSMRLAQTNRPNAPLARALFKTGLAGMQSGVVPTVRGHRIEPAAARAAASSFKEALDIVPASVLYRYFYAVSLRYAEGFEAALSEFKHVLEQDPGNYEARQQVIYGPRWHDAFAYPGWPPVSAAPTGATLPPALSALLPQGDAPLTRVALLREGANKVVAFLSRTPSGSWSIPPQPHMSAGMSVVLSRTSHGPILALYVTLTDNVHSPYVGETFLNPREPVALAEDACQLGQYMLEQLARQDHTYAIFVDEHHRVLLSRRLTFDTTTQVLLARVLYETQTLPPQPLEADRYRQAAHWHMEHFSLESVAEHFRPL